MAELLDKLIQNGRVSFVPRSPKTRAFWTKYNAKIAGSQNAAMETVTIVPATQEEMDEYYRLLNPVSIPTTAPKEAATQEIESLKKALAEQQKLINQLLESKSVESETVKEKGKPGPKPKNNTDGESKQTENA